MNNTNEQILTLVKERLARELDSSWWSVNIEPLTLASCGGGRVILAAPRQQILKAMPEKTRARALEIWNKYNPAKSIHFILSSPPPMPEKERKALTVLRCTDRTKALRVKSVKDYIAMEKPSSKVCDVDIKETEIVLVVRPRYSERRLERIRTQGLDLTAEYYMVDRDDLTKKRKGNRRLSDKLNQVRDARKQFIFFLHKTVGLSTTRVGSILDIDHSTVVYHLKRTKLDIEYDGFMKKNFYE
jgi:chromosomal replication initiation ATPase DnaA